MFNICSPRRNIIFALSPRYLRSSLSPQTPAGSGSSPLASIAHPLPGLCVSSWFIYYPWEGLLTRHNNNPAAEKRGEILSRLGTWDTSPTLQFYFLYTFGSFNCTAFRDVRILLFGLNWEIRTEGYCGLDLGLTTTPFWVIRSQCGTEAHWGVSGSGDTLGWPLSEPQCPI